MAEMEPLNNTGADGLNDTGSGSPLEKVAQAEKPLSNPTVIGYHPTDAESKMRWDQESGIGYIIGCIDVGGGAAVHGGYSVKLNPEGGKSVQYYCD